MTPTTTVYIVNPSAGRGRGARTWRRLATRLDATGLTYHVDFTSNAGDATILARKWLQEGIHTIVAVGGDGTASEVVNGFFERGNPVAPSARVAFVPAGTGNDIARQFSLPDPAHLGEATTIVDILRLRYSTADGAAPERYALFHVGVGLAVEAVETSNHMKTRSARLAYAAGTAVALYRHRPREIRFSCDDGRTLTRDLTFIFAANGKYTGGGMKIAPMASMEDGAMDVITLEGASRFDMLFRLLPAVYRGAHLRHPAFAHRPAHTLHLDSDDPLTVEVDGELVGTTPVQIDVLPHALPVCTRSNGHDALLRRNIM